ncbi:MAG TPA: sugar phosphate isomerase/epimerase [Croceibacterium sp.]|nr:sugar phosphate isomerase/epimerase [Croceibacterium sp.]
MSISRRTFIARAGLAAAGAALAGAPGLARSSGFAPGVQLWTVKDEAARDLDGTLRALATLGYRRVEAAGWHGRTPAQFRDAVRAAGLECVSAHYSLRDLLEDSESRLAFARDVGVTYVVASSPAPSRPLDPNKSWALANAEAMTLADWRSNAEAMDRIGQRARAMGLVFGYHNHSAEFLDYDGFMPMDEIMRLTEPANVVLELDLGWVAGAGHDPVRMLERYAPRIHLLHVKDLATAERVPGKIVDDERTTPVGEGTIDWRAVFRAAERAPIHSYFVEQEAPFTEPPLEALAKSVAFLRRIAS